MARAQVRGLDKLTLTRGTPRTQTMTLLALPRTISANLALMATTSARRLETPDAPAPVSVLRISILSASQSTGSAVGLRAGNDYRPTYITVGHL